MCYILDACALLAFLNDEEGADKIEDLLGRSADVSVSMSIVNLLEVYYGELRDKGAEIAQIVLDMAQYYSIKIINTISEQAFREAACRKTYGFSARSLRYAQTPHINSWSFAVGKTPSYPA